MTFTAKMGCVGQCIQILVNMEKGDILQDKDTKFLYYIFESDDKDDLIVVNDTFCGIKMIKFKTDVILRKDLNPIYTIGKKMDVSVMNEFLAGFDLGKKAGIADAISKDIRY